MTDPLDQIHHLDLSALADCLDAQRRHRRLVGVIRRAVGTASANQDFTEAARALEILQLYAPGLNLDKDTGRAEATIAAALVAHSVILYCRATETKSNERIKWFGRQMLSAEHQGWHKQIKDYRDEALAHFGRGNSENGGLLVRDALTLKRVASGSGSQIAVVFYDHRALFRAKVVNMLSALVDEGIRLVDLAWKRGSDDVVKELKRGALIDSGLPELARSFRLDDPDRLNGPLHIHTEEGVSVRIFHE
jgi:hypothetical protein